MIRMKHTRKFKVVKMKTKHNVLGLGSSWKNNNLWEDLEYL
jgi:GMP synthase PP-ATPase subunit